MVSALPSEFVSGIGSLKSPASSRNQIVLPSTGFPSKVSVALSSILAPESISNSSGETVRVYEEASNEGDIDKDSKLSSPKKMASFVTMLPTDFFVIPDIIHSSQN